LDAWCGPDLLVDLERVPWVCRCTVPVHAATDELTDEGSVIRSDSFNEVHAYEVLEHLGQQGDALAFFRHFSEIWRVLKPGGLLCACVPALHSPWLWGDPGHRRAITPESLTFLIQPEYAKQVGRTPMTDYRSMYFADFDPIAANYAGDSFQFILRAVKPARLTP